MNAHCLKCRWCEQVDRNSYSCCNLPSACSGRKCFEPIEESEDYDVYIDDDITNPHNENN